MSSDSEFQEPDYENMSRNIIAEVKKRPALYDKTLVEYNNKHDRKRLWQEIYRSIFKDWADFTDEKQKIEGEMIQKKWKNIKDSFLKELAYQKGKTHKKKRKYIHYDSLLFLLPSLQKGHEGATTKDPLAGTALARSSQPVNEDTTSMFQVPDKEDDIDEEKHFALMLVPMLRKLNDNQKHYAKIEILNVLHKARSLTVAWPTVQYMMEVQTQPAGGTEYASSPMSANHSDVEGRETRVKQEI